MSSLQQGRSLARLLYRSWRRDLERPEISVPISQAILDLAHLTGTSGLVLRNLERINYPEEALEPLRNGFRLQVLRDDLYVREGAKAITALLADGIQPIVLKGLTVSEFYPTPGLRPTTDVDLLIADAELHRTQSILGEKVQSGLPIDLHTELWELKDVPAEEVWNRAQPFKWADLNLRKLCPEHQLRQVCLHFLRHGGYRPIWLCDIALIAETHGQQLDWDYCMKGHPVRTEWLICALALAQRLLGAEIPYKRAQERAEQLPTWLIHSVLRQWGGKYLRYSDPEPIARSLLRPWKLPRALWTRWPNALEATISTGGRINAMPRLPYQCMDCVYRGFAALLGIKGEHTPHGGID